MVKRLTVNVEDSMHYDLKLLAAKDGITVTEIVINLLENFIKKHK